MGVPSPVGTRWGSPCWNWTGVAPPPRLGLDVSKKKPCPGQETEQQSEHLLQGGRYASCVHAGGLSCSEFAFETDRTRLMNV